jgi:hypothetical protein
MCAAGEVRPAYARPAGSLGSFARPRLAGRAAPRRASHAREPAVAIGRLSLLNREQLPA